MSSHIISLVEELCDHVAIMRDGRVATAGPIREVAGRGELEDQFVRLVGRADVVEEELTWLDSSSG